MATANANVTAATTASQPQTATSAPDPANSSNSKASTASSNSILQNRLSQCSQPKSYTAPGPHSPATGAASSNNHGQPLQLPQDHNSMDHAGHANFSSDLQQPESPSLKMKIKRSNSTNFSNGNSAAGNGGSGGSSDASTGGGAGSAGDKQTSGMESLNTSNQLAASKKQSANSKKRKDATTSSSSSSSSRSSSPRSTASPISQLPPFLLAAMSGSGGGNPSGPGGNGGPRLDALLRQVATNGPPSKKAKLNGDCSNGSVESDESASPASVASPAAGLAGNTSGGHPEAATMTEPESLGPCEPGTAVKVSGIVWNETEKGLLMLNVTWKGKTYMGTLLDCHIPLEEHKWGPPGELPVERMKGGKRGRCTRSRTPPVRMPHNRKSQKAVNNKSNARAKQLFSMPVSPLTKENGQSNRGNSNRHPFLQNCLTTNPKTLKLEFNPDDDNEESSDIKEDSGDENNPADPSEAMSPTSRLIECPKGLCAKKFRDLDALKYHLSYAHDNLNKAAEIKAEKLKLEQKLLAEQKLQAMIKKEAAEKENLANKPTNNSTNGNSSLSSKNGNQKLSSNQKIKSEINANTTNTTANNVMVKTENNGAVKKESDLGGYSDVKPTVPPVATSATVPGGAPVAAVAAAASQEIKLEPSNRNVKNEIQQIGGHAGQQPQQSHRAAGAAGNPHAQRPQISDAPLDFTQKRPVSPAYSDISDEEPVLPQPPQGMRLTPKGNSLAGPPMTSNLPSLNSLVQRAGPPQLHTGRHHNPADSRSHHGHSMSRDLDQRPPPPPAGSTKHILQQPPPQAHGASLKRPGNSSSLEESLKRPPQFMPPGFPPGFPSQLLSGVAGAGLPAHLAAAVASGRYPPGFMPVAPQLPPGFSAARSPFFNPQSSSQSSQSSAAASASAKLQELQDRVMASSRPSGMHLGQMSQAMSQSGNPAMSQSSFSNLARDLMPHGASAAQNAQMASHYNNLSRMAGQLSAAGLLPASASKHLPNFPGGPK